MKKGFTLAEVLITIVILGVIAAMTIPVAITATKEKETISALNKAYSTLQKALYTSQAKDDGFVSWSIPETGQVERAEAVAKLIMPHLNVMNVCGTGKGCFPDTTYKYLNGSDWANIDERTDLYKFALTDGTSIAIKMYDASSPNSQGFFVDVNGFKGPNVRGRDEFVFLLNPDTNMILPYGKDLSDADIKSDCSKTGQGNYCATYVLRYGKLDYIK